MKALKQKRISLRSLWRRGLVILSLFALVFASCSDSEGSSSEGSGGEAPYAMRVITGPSNFSFQGQPVDLTGVAVQVSYPSGRTQTITDVRSFSTEPKIATGYYHPTWGFVGKRDYKLLVSVGGKAFAEDILLPYTDYITPTTGAGHAPWGLQGFHVGVIGIARESAKSNPSYVSGNPTNPIDRPIYSTQGLQITGTMRNRSYYVDDPVDFGGLVCEANYYNGIKLPVSLNLQDIDWGLYPHYDNGTETGTGSLYITAGRHREEYNPEHMLAQKPVTLSATSSTPWVATILASDATYNDANKIWTGPDTWRLDSGVTGIVAISQVYHVTKLEFEVAPKFDPYFYWQADNWYQDDASDPNNQWFNPWIWRARDCGTVIKPTYSNGGTKTFTIDQALAQNPVWWNEATQQDKVTNFDQDSPMPGTGVSVPFDIISIQYSDSKQTHHFANKDPHVTFYYRGHRLRVDVPVYTRYMSLSVASSLGETPEVDMSRIDNDNRRVMNDVVFSKTLTVKAEYSAYSNPDLTESIELVYDAFAADKCMQNNPNGQFAVTDIAPIGTPPTKNLEQVGSFYTMNFGNNPTRWDFKANPTYTGPAFGTGDWGQCDNPNNNNRERPVTVYYAVPPYYNELNNYTQQYAGRNVSNRFQVAWSGID